MKKISGRDLLFIAILAVMIGILSFGPGKGKGKGVPRDEQHHSMYDSLKAGRTQAETELLCATCHGKAGIPLSKNHPPKEQCLICHLLG